MQCLTDQKIAAFWGEAPGFKAESESMSPKAPAYSGFFIEKKPPCTLSVWAL
jgi:hypothetical protein